MLHASMLLGLALSYIGYRYNWWSGWIVGLLAVLAVLTRPEALAVFVTTVCFEVAYRIHERKPLVFRSAVTMVVVFLALYPPYFLWRWTYFGDLLPSTDYARTGGGLIQWQGRLKYLRESLVFAFAGMASVLVVGLLFVRWRRPVGPIGYYSNRTVIDMVGLTDRFITHQPFDPAYIKTWRPGHDKGDGAYVLSRHPDYIQLTDYLTGQPWPGPGDDALEFKSIAEIWAAPSFHAHYEFDPLQVDGGWYYNLFRRIDATEVRRSASSETEQPHLDRTSKHPPWTDLSLRLDQQPLRRVSMGPKQRHLVRLLSQATMV